LVPVLQRIQTSARLSQISNEGKLNTMYYDRVVDRPRCPFARTFLQIAEQTIFAHVTDRTTPDMYEAALQSLLELCHRLESQVGLFHFPSAVGIHVCVQDAYLEAAFRLKNLAIMQQPPLSEPAQPTQQVITREGIVRDVEEKIQTSTEETDLGRDAQLPDLRRYG
jgi:hypothetical protein